MSGIVRVRFHGRVSTFSLQLLDRARIHGSRKCIAVDEKGEECATVSLTQDGRFLLPAGSTADVYINGHGDSVERSEIVMVDDEGSPLPQLAATTDQIQEISEPVAATDLLDYIVEKVYALSRDLHDTELQKSLAHGHIYRLRFRNRSNVEASPAYLLANESGSFLLLCRQSGFGFVEPTAAMVIDEFESDDTDDDWGFDVLVEDVR